MKSDALIEQLVADLAPVRPVSVATFAASLVGVVAAMVLAAVGVLGLRADLVEALGTTGFGSKALAVIAVALFASIACVRSLRPEARPTHGLVAALVALVLAVLAGAAAALLTDDPRPWTDRVRLGSGLTCYFSILSLSVPMLAVLGAWLRRGAPAHPARSAWAAGLAAGAWAAFAFAWYCRFDEPVYVTLWYTAGVATVVALARLALPPVLRW